MRHHSEVNVTTASFSCQREMSVIRFCGRAAKLRRAIVELWILEHRSIRVGDGANFSREPVKRALKSYRVVAQAFIRWASTGVHRHAVRVGRDRIVEIRTRVEQPCYTRSAIRFSRAGRKSELDDLGGQLKIFKRQGEGAARCPSSHSLPVFRRGVLGDI